jgi:hypothetical protein
MKNRLKKFMLSFLYNNAAKDLRFVSRLRAQWQAAEFIEDNMQEAIYIPDRHKMFDFALNKANPDGLHLELGVWKGNDINYMAKKYPDRCFYGFDAFEGLPGNWIGDYPKGTFSTGGQIPNAPKNVEFVKGWIKDTMSYFISDCVQSGCFEFNLYDTQAERGFSFIHLDFDMYRPTKEFFEIASRGIAPGTIILFDEFFGFPNWQDNEYRAWENFCCEKWGEADTSANNVIFKYLAYGDAQVCIKIL